jgi:hypothetical protein
MIKKIISSLVLASALLGVSLAQTVTHVYPALDTNNNFTGQNGFTKPVGMSSSVGTLPAASTNSGSLVIVTDGITASDCTVGGGTNQVLCASNGSIYRVIGGGTFTTNAIVFGTSSTTSRAATASDLASISFADATGAANAYIVTLGIPPATLVPNLTVNFLPNAANTSTTPTLNVNGLGAITITKNGSNALSFSDIVSTAIATVKYDGTNWELQNPQTGSPASFPSSVQGKVLVSNGTTFVPSFNAPFFTASGVTLYGDSITVGFGATYPWQSYAGLISGVFGTPFANSARSGDQAADTARVWVFPNTVTTYSNIGQATVQGVNSSITFIQPKSPNSSVMIGTNDGNGCGSSAGCQANYSHALQAVVSDLAIPNQFKTWGQSCATTSGTTAPDNTIPGVPALESITNGTVITCVTPSNPNSTTVDVVWRGIDGNTGTATVSVDGVAEGTLNGFGFNGQVIHTQNATTDTLFANEYTVTAATTHTVVFTVTSATGASNIFSAVYVAALPTGGYTTTSPPSVLVLAPVSPTGTVAATYGALASAVAAGYSNQGMPVRFVNTPAFMSNSTDFQATPINISGRTLTDVSTTSGSATVTSASANFGSNSIGQLLEINGAGTAGGWLDSYIVSVANQTTAVINTPAITTGSGLTTLFGPNGQVCGLNTGTPTGIHPTNCGMLHIRDAILATAQPVTQSPTVNPVWSGLGFINSLLLGQAFGANPVAPPLTISQLQNTSTNPALFITDFSAALPAAFASGAAPHIVVNSFTNGPDFFDGFNAGSKTFSIASNGQTISSNQATYSQYTATQTPNSVSSPIIYAFATGATAVSSWGTHPPMYGANLNLSLVANFIDFRVNGASTSTFFVDQNGNETTIGAVSPKIIGAEGSPNVSGCASSALVGGASLGSFTAGATSCTVVITPGVTATHGFFCKANDITTPADTITQTSASTTTTATLSGTVVGGDVIAWQCAAY